MCILACALTLTHKHTCLKACTHRVHVAKRSLSESSLAPQAHTGSTPIVSGQYVLGYSTFDAPEGYCKHMYAHAHTHIPIQAPMHACLLPQEEGNYRLAHAKLFHTVQQREGLGFRPPQELLRSLRLVHSYTLVKSLVAIGDHATAARMLVRVAK